MAMHAEAQVREPLGWMNSDNKPDVVFLDFFIGDAIGPN